MTDSNTEKDHPVNQPLDEERKTRNLNIATRLQGLLEGSQDPTYVEFVSLDGTIDINIHKVVEEEGENIGFPFDILPETFARPSYGMEIFSNGQPLLVQTPYGLLPDKIVGADGKLYLFGKVFVFDAEGRDGGFEHVVESTDPLERAINIQRVPDLSPSEADSRVVPLEERDYQKVLLHINLVEKGQFKLRQV